MKSLEIVNENIKVLEEQLNELEDELDKTCIEIELKQLQQIKQDLNVLEIIRKKIVNVNILKMLLIGFPLEKVLEMYNEDHYELTLEELLKLNQWLEVNENGN